MIFSIRHVRVAALILLCSSANAWAATAPASSSAPVTIQQAIRAALARYPAYQQARLATQAAEQNLRVARAGWLPTVGVTGSYLHTSPNANVPGGLAFLAGNAPDEYVGQLGLNQPIYQGGLVRASIDRSQADLEAARQAELQAGNSLSYEVISEYAAILKAEHALAISQSALATSQAHLREGQIKLQHGTIAQVDATRNALDLANAQLAVEQAEGQLQIARTQFSGTTGLPADAPLTPMPAFSPPMGDLQAFLSRAYAQRPEIKAAAARTRSAQAAAQIVGAARRPQIALVGAAGWDSPQFFTPSTAGWNAGLNVSMPVFEGGRLAAQERAAAITAKSAAQDEAQARLTVQLDVAQAREDLAQKLKQSAIADRSVQLARSAATMARKGFSLGAVSNLEYQLTQQALFTAERQQADARLDAALALERLKWAMGESLP